MEIGLPLRCRNWTFDVECRRYGLKMNVENDSNATSNEKPNISIARLELIIITSGKKCILIFKFRGYRGHHNQ